MGEDTPEVSVLLKNLSPKDFLHVGVEQIAYIRPVSVDENGKGFAIHSADGRQITVMDSYSKAVAMVQQHDLHPVTVH